MWLISRAPPLVDITALPMVVRRSLADKQSQVRYYYVPLKNKDVAISKGASHREYWCCCWDVYADVAAEFYEFQHTEGKEFAFVRVDDVERPPLDSAENALWKEMVHVQASLMRKALELHIWSAEIRQLKRTMKRRANLIQEHLRAVISQARRHKDTEKQTDGTILRSHACSRVQKRLSSEEYAFSNKAPRTSAKPIAKRIPRQPTYPPRQSDYDLAVASGYLTVSDVTSLMLKHGNTIENTPFQSNLPVQ